MNAKKLIGTLARWYLGAAIVTIMIVAPLAIVFLDPKGIGEGLRTLWAIYSPLNLLNWLVVMAVLLPGLLVGMWADKDGA